MKDCVCLRLFDGCKVYKVLVCSDAQGLEKQEFEM